jgi:hypothetical protein
MSELSSYTPPEAEPSTQDGGRTNGSGSAEYVSLDQMNYDRLKRGWDVIQETPEPSTKQPEEPHSALSGEDAFDKMNAERLSKGMEPILFGSNLPSEVVQNAPVLINERDPHRLVNPHERWKELLQGKYKELVDTPEVRALVNSEHNRTGSIELRKLRALTASMRSTNEHKAFKSADPQILKAIEHGYAQLLEDELPALVRRMAEEQGQNLTPAAEARISDHLLQQERFNLTDMVVEQKERHDNSNFINRFRSNPVVRRRIGLALSAVGIGLTATGVGGVAGVALMGAGAGMRAVGGYEAAMGHMERRGAKQLRKEGSALYNGDIGQEKEADANLTKEQVQRRMEDEAFTRLSLREVDRRLAALSSAEARTHRSDEQRAEDERAITLLRAVHARHIVEATSGLPTGATQQDKLMKALEYSWKQQNQESKQWRERSQDATKKRFLKAAVAGGLLMALPIAGRALDIMPHLGGHGNSPNHAGSHHKGMEVSARNRASFHRSAEVQHPADGLRHGSSGHQVGEHAGSHHRGPHYPKYEKSDVRADVRPKSLADHYHIQSESHLTDTEWQGHPMHDFDVKVQPGDSQWRIAHKLLNYHESFRDAPPAGKRLAVDRLKDLMGGDNLIKPGEHIKVSAKMMKDALSYKTRMG